MKKNKKNPRGRFYMLCEDTWQSAAWIASGPCDRAIYLFMATKYNGRNNGKIACSARAAAKATNVGKDTAAASLNRLAEKGFIVPTKLGSFNQKTALATEYRLTEFPWDSNPPTFDFKFWTPRNNPKRKILRSLRSDRSVPQIRPNGPSDQTDGECGPD